jgi:hypothetical protein
MLSSIPYYPIFFMLLLSCFIHSAGCTYEKPRDLIPVACDTTALTYNEQLKPLIDQNCALPACHGGSQNPPLTNYAQVSSRIERIRVRALVQQTMPPSGPLGSCSSQKISKWIERGFPEK